MNNIKLRVICTECGKEVTSRKNRVYEEPGVYPHAHINEWTNDKCQGSFQKIKDE